MIYFLEDDESIRELVCYSLNKTDTPARGFGLPSELYAALEEEETKLWHLSPKALYELYAEEKATGKISYPEEA